MEFRSENYRKPDAASLRIDRIELDRSYFASLR
jgi:hypothetical protein